ncbi:hydrolase [Serratia sp. S1B]|nr:hydrolase [Serratia sp. S1B]
MTQHNNVQGATTKPTESSLYIEYRATYSPDDNKLRLYASVRLDKDTYDIVSKAGFKWAPKQKLFVAPAWTPGREDLLIELAGEIEDEDNSLFDRQAERAERFSDYSEKRGLESEQTLNAVDKLASQIPFGQPILVGHHSERKARKHAEKIENGMKKATMLFERSEYWEQRAAASLRHAKYKELPAVRYRRIKKIEADLRKSEKNIERAEKYLKLWRSELLDLKMALAISNYEHISVCFTLDKYPRPKEKSQYEGYMGLYSALTEEIITPQQASEIATRCHERTIKHSGRWVAHYRNRLSYERAMLGESGSVLASAKHFKVGGRVKSRGEWLSIIKINKRGGEITSLETKYYSFLGCDGVMKLTVDRITDYMAPTEEEEKTASKAAKKPPIVNFEEEGCITMTKAEWAAKHRDYKSVRGVTASENNGAYRYRRAMTKDYKLASVFISDMKVVEIPKK